MKLHDARQIIPPGVTWEPTESTVSYGSGNYENQFGKRKRENIEEGLPERQRQAIRLAVKGKHEKNKTRLTDFRREDGLKFECYERIYYGPKVKAIVNVGKFNGNCNRTWTYWRNRSADGFVRRDWRSKDGQED